ncbi:hypothetical protein GJ496_005801 [Pomphorhynchus laevis]|nr:hypothetical protein GJ496_005801 [Pomphorhynchus laevis]
MKNCVTAMSSSNRYSISNSPRASMHNLWVPQSDYANQRISHATVNRQPLYIGQTQSNYDVNGRLPTVRSNIYERTIVVRPRRKIFHEIIEKPMPPPAIVRTKYVIGERPPPQYFISTITVPASVCSDSTQYQFN